MISSDTTKYYILHQHRYVNPYFPHSLLKLDLNLIESVHHSTDRHHQVYLSVTYTPEWGAKMRGPHFGSHKWSYPSEKCSNDLDEERNWSGSSG